MKNEMTFLSVALLLAALLIPAAHAQRPGPPEPPMREFRAVWIATVVNLDWPSSRFLSTSQAQSELIAIFDEMEDLNMNAAIFQVRSGCDAIYNSNLEPWSRWLTGTEGVAPSPYWDPLQFAIDEAHKRGIELHAWFNPYRARPESSYTHAPNHIANTRPDLVVNYDGQQWLNPGEPDVMEHSLNVVMDVVSRYDIDGVHFDDYFYPYPDGPFPDDATYQRYLNGGGTLDLGDWRRQNVDTFVKMVYDAIKAEKPEVRFGLSPFGIWRNNVPSGIVGFDAYSQIYADSRKWINEGWIDYFSPQIYWAIDPPDQSFTALLDWWISENDQNRHVWPGMALYKMAGSNDWPANEIVRQITEARNRPQSRGTIGFRMENLQTNLKGLASTLKSGLFAEPALVPASPWLDGTPPQSPDVALFNGTLYWTPRGEEEAFRWVVYWDNGGGWNHEILNREARSKVFGFSLDYYAVTAVDEVGNESTLQVLPPVPQPSQWGIE
mgnify:CR=1 FL=1